MIQNSLISEIPIQTKHYRWGFITAVMAIAVGGMSWVIVQHYAESAAIDAEVKRAAEPLIKTVTALGRLQPKGDIINLSASSLAGSHRVAALKVKPGDTVNQGQVVAILDVRDQLDAAMVEARSQVAIAQTRLAQVKAGTKVSEINAQNAEIARIEAEVQGKILEQQGAIADLKTAAAATIATQQANLQRLASTDALANQEYQRYQMLNERGAVSDSALESRRLALETARQEISTAEAVLSQTTQETTQQIKEAQELRSKLEASGQHQVRQAQAVLTQVTQVKPVDIEMAEAEVVRANAALKQAQVNLEQSYVRSPQDGVILNVLAQPGEIISNNGIVEIGQTKNMYAVAEIYQNEIFKIKPGQTAIVTSDSISGELKGKVDWVEPKTQHKDGFGTPSNPKLNPSDNIDNPVMEVHIHLDPESSRRVQKMTNSPIKMVIEL